MERVAKALAENDLGTALVRLWVLAGNQVRLNDWEQQRISTRDADAKALAIGIKENRIPAATQLNTMAIALIVAVDRMLAYQHERSQ